MCWADRGSCRPLLPEPPGSNRGPDKGKTLMSHWYPAAGVYAAPWVMAPISTRIVCKSNAMLGDKYGVLSCSDQAS